MSVFIRKGSPCFYFDFQLQKVRYAGSTFTKDREEAERAEAEAKRRAREGALAKPGNATHGMSGTPTYSTWIAMKERCTNPEHNHYEDYGGRGITVCAHWLHSFENFLSDMGVRPEGKTLDRKDGNENYEPGNCRWATDEEQNNNRSNTRWLVIGGKKVPLTIAVRSLLRTAVEEGAPFVYKRIASGWSVERALRTPARKRSTRLAQAARAAGIQYATVYRRIERGWTEESALAAPARSRSPRPLP